jgi:succinyl-CoA synthetase beta subunit
VEIEDIAIKDPDAIHYVPIDIKTGITTDQANEVADKLELKGDAKETIAIIVCHMYELFVKKEAILLEINPFVEVSCGDCKLRNEKAEIHNFSNYIFYLS